MSVDDWWDDLWFCSFEQHVLITCIGEWFKAWFRPRLLMPCISAAHCWTVLTVMWWSWPHTFLSRLWFCLLQKSCSTTLWSRKVKHHQMTGVFFSWYCFLFCFFFFLFFSKKFPIGGVVWSRGSAYWGQCVSQLDYFGSEKLSQADGNSAPFYNCNPYRWECQLWSLFNAHVVLFLSCQ